MKASLAFLVGALLAITSCSKDSGTATNNNGNGNGNGNNNNTTTSPYNMSAIIGGAAFSRDSCSFYFPNLLDTTNAEIFGWAGYPTTRSDYYPQITLDIDYTAYHGAGTYVFSNPGNCNAKLQTSATLGESSTDGSITITSVYPTVVGTFSFTTPSGVKVTNGTFTAMRQ